MKYDFVCNTLTFNSLNDDIKTEIDKIAEYIQSISDQIDIIVNPDNWDSPESPGVITRSTALKEDLNTCKKVLNGYYEILDDEREKAKTRILDIHTKITTPTDTNPLGSYFRQ